MRTDNRGNVNLSPAPGMPPARIQPDTPPPERVPQEARPPSKADDSKGSKLIVGPDIKLKGVEITDCDTLVVEGRVEASMDSRIITIAERGVFAGTVGIDLAEIHGRFEGELTARKQLVIRATGRVSGKIRYGKITIEEGGQLSGDVGTLNPSPAVPAMRSAPDAPPHDLVAPHDALGRNRARPSYPGS